MKVVYSTPSCPGCVQLKKKLNEEGTEFKEMVIGKDITKEEFWKKYPSVKSVPFLVEE